MNIAEIISVAKAAGEVFNKILDKLPDHDQKVMQRYFDFLNVYQTEQVREDVDMDYLLDLRERNRLLTETVLKTIREKK